MDFFKAAGSGAPIRLKSRRLPAFIICVLLFAVVMYFVFAAHYKNTFFSNSTLNGCDVSGMSAGVAAQKLYAAAGEYTLTLITREGSEIIRADDIGLCADVNVDKIGEIISEQNNYAWPMYAFFKKEYTADSAAVSYSYDDDLMAQVLDSLYCVSPERPEQASNAYLTFSGGEIITVPETYGNTADRDALERAVRIAMQSQTAVLDLAENGVYDEPTVHADDAELTAKRDLLNEIADITIELTFGNDTRTADISEIMNWLYATNTDGEYSLAADSDVLADYAQSLAESYDTWEDAVDFTTTGGDTVTLAGDYGWRLDTEYTAQALGELAPAGTSVSYDLTDRSEESSRWWKYTAVTYGTEGSEYYGDSYAEVNVASQHMWLYKSGELAMESNIVTGNPGTGHDTPTGAFHIRALRTDTTLNGEDYSVDVAYFIVFADDIGFHDAVWQPYFGGDLYRTNGSHGCVNMPLESVEEMYELVYMNMPVFVY